MGMGLGLGAALEAIGDAILEGSKRNYTSKQKKIERDEYIDREIELARRKSELKLDDPLYQASVKEKEARTAKYGRGGGGGGAGPASILKTAQGKNAFIATMTQADEDTRAKYLANPTLAVADPNFKTAFESYVSKPGNKGGDKMAALGRALGVPTAGVSTPAAPAVPTPATSIPTKRPPLTAFYK